MSLPGRVRFRQEEGRGLLRPMDPASRALQDYLAYLRGERKLKEATLANYRRDIGEFTEFLRSIGVPSLAKVNRPILWRWRDYMMTRGYSPLSIARRAGEVKAFFSFLVRQGALDSNPLVYLSLPKVERCARPPLTQEEAEKLLASAGRSGAIALRDRAILELLYATGLRLGELWDLNLSSVNLAEREVAVLGEGSRRRIIPMGGAATEALRTYLEEIRPLLRGGTSTGALFLSRSGRRLSKRSIQAIVQKTARRVYSTERSGLEDKLTARSMRDAFTAHLLEAGGDKRIVKLLLGSSRLNLKGTGVG